MDTTTQMVRRTGTNGRSETFGPMHPDMAKELAARSVELGYIVERYSEQDARGTVYDAITVVHCD
jgi:hypothetical protein